MLWVEPLPEFNQPQGCMDESASRLSAYLALGPAFKVLTRRLRNLNPDPTHHVSASTMAPALSGCVSSDCAAVWHRLWDGSCKFRFDLQTLVRLNIYLFVPAFIFVKVTGAARSADRSQDHSLYLEFHCLHRGHQPLLRRDLERRSSHPHRIAAFDHVLQLREFWSASHGTGSLSGLGPLVQVFVLMTMNVSTFTLGLFMAHSSVASSDGEGSAWRKALGSVLRQPAVYAIALAWCLKGLGVPIQEMTFIWRPLAYLADALVAVALVTSGCNFPNRCAWHERASDAFDRDSSAWGSLCGSGSDLAVRFWPDRRHFDPWNRCPCRGEHQPLGL